MSLNSAAGVASLFITQDYFHSNEGISCGGNVENPYITKGLNWITKHYDQIIKAGKKS